MYAQTTVSGIVRDESGELLIGVSVREVGNLSNGTITDFNGSFRLVLKGKNPLQFSYVGYETLDVQSGDNMVVVMKPTAIEMQEVVVVGYGTQRKETVSGAITTVKGEDLLKTTASNLSNTLAGRVSGITTLMGSGRPGLNESTIYIRGVSTLSSGNTNPLVLVDGVERDMGSVDADDIESFTVLKDAAATAVYGIRGANGVILITTKRGTEGKAKISATVQHSQNQLIRLPEILNAYEYAFLRNEALLNDGLPLEFTLDDLQKYKDHSSPYTHPDNNYPRDFLRKYSPKTQVNININGGTDIIKYFVSANYLNEKGLMQRYAKASDLEKFDTFRELPDDLKRTFSDVPYDPNPSYDRFNLRTNFDIKISKTTNIAVNLTSRVEKIKNIGIGQSDKQEFFTRIFRTSPQLFPLITPNGKFGAQGGDNQSPLVYLTSAGYQLDNKNTIEGTIRLNQKLDFLLKGLSADGEISFDNFVKSGWSLNHRPEIGRYTKTGVYTMITSETDWSTSAQAKTTNRQLISQLALRYNNTFALNHNVGALLLTKQRQFYADAALPSHQLDYVSRVTYNYKRKYITEMNMAYNGSSNFNKENRFGFFPSVSLGWVASEESFWKHYLSAEVDYFKLRGSIGEVGNDRLGSMNYFYQNSYGDGSPYNFGTAAAAVGTTGYWETQIGNPLVTWERALKGNIGVDLRVFKAVNFTIDYFHEYRYDILAKRNTYPLAYGFNYALPAENLGVVRNQGVEFSMNINEKIGNFQYWVDANITFARNKIIEMDEVAYPDELAYKRQTGLPVGSRFGYIVEGFYQSWDEINDPNTPTNLLNSARPGDLKYSDRNGDGFINDYDIGYIAPGKVPELTGGLTLGAFYKGFSIDMMWQGAALSTIYLGNSSVMVEFKDAVDNLKGIHKERWAYYTDPFTGEEIDTRATAKFHRLTTDNSYFNKPSTDRYRRSDYLRLKNIEFAYTLDTELVQKINMSKLMLFVRGNNVLLFDKLKNYGVDPEAPDDTIFFYPQIRTFTMGFTANF